MSKSPKATPMPSAEEAGSIQAFTAWRQSKKFVVGAPLQSRKKLKASARVLRQRIAPESAWGRLVRRVSFIREDLRRNALKLRRQILKEGEQ